MRRHSPKLVVQTGKMVSSKDKSDSANTRQRSGWRGSIWNSRLIVVVLLVCAVPFVRNASRKSEQELQELPRYQVSRSSIQLKDRPDYIPIDLLERVWQQAEIPEQFSILEPGLAEKLGKAFEKSPWVRKVNTLQLNYPKSIAIDLEFRQPVALVRSQQGFYPVDRDGILLPPSDFSVSELSKYPIIDNVQTLPQGAAGTHWGDLAVWGAARLVELLVPEGNPSRYWKKYDLAYVRVHGQAELGPGAVEQLHQISYRLVTRTGSEVIWGVAPDVSDPTEPNAETKLKRLDMYHRDFGSLQSEQGPVEIDLRRWKDIARRPLQLPHERTYQR